MSYLDMMMFLKPNKLNVFKYNANYMIFNYKLKYFNYLTIIFRS